MNEHLQLFSDEEKWKAYYNRLTQYARALLASGEFRGDLSIRGKSPEDIAQEAMIAVWEGTRRYDPNSGEEFIDYLMGVVKSRINALRKRAGHESLWEEDGDDEAPTTDISGRMTSQRTQELAAETLSELSEFLQSEPKLFEVFQCWMAGFTDRADVAQRLKVTPTEITNRQKRIGRRVEDFLKIRRSQMAATPTTTDPRG
ncbi:hypothetical protein IAD21_06390 (plasmid) [Abditibacteriota bacterium]|nr:hypothetical protein IAD21_06390 [Abditibacteriota bacterium]